MVRGIVAGFILGLIAVAAGVWYYFGSGRAPVATTDPDMPFEKTFAHRALNARIDRQPAMESPVPADEPNLLQGALVYRENCAVCHGVPGGLRSNISAGMYPKPPELFRGTGVTDDPASESYWKAANGIRLSGMPGFKAKLTDTQLWQVSQLVAHADKLPDAVMKQLAPPPPVTSPSLAPVPLSPTR
jgi:mono/diheme cytochrome c family protein